VGTPIGAQRVIRDLRLCVRRSAGALACAGAVPRGARASERTVGPVDDGRQRHQIRVFLLDDHEVVRRGVADVRESDPDITVVGEAKNATEALARVPALRPDVAVLDVRLPDGDGVSVCRELRSRMPELRVVMLTSYSDDEALFEAIMAGASGYLLKQILGQDLVAGIRAVAEGGSLLDPTATTAVLERLRRVAEPAGPLAKLSDQERTVLELIGEGLTNRQIGERMFLAEKTVKNYVSHLLAKLGLERRTQAAVLATELRGTGTGSGSAARPA
jgi:two-component system, NarL family, response regulator DevR